ncbi:MAG: tRNA (guanine-N7)-methyltransferase [Chlorobiaceae bacterium]|nr:tRNA (guanine-N7)-methyltransferase [Chlorobiaceae bacterium]NTW10783.1 tRNA (guanine-N7)-methyltransferase [Chlorobiaceae bacterium]
MDTTISLCRNHDSASGQYVQADQLLTEAKPVEVEIGFGDGDYLIRRALAHPERMFIGIEHKPSLIAGVSKKAASLHAGNIRFLQSCANDAFANYFSSCSLSRVYALFPDPWPKRKHVKYRLFSTPYLRLLNNRLMPGGEALIVTDSEDYSRWILRQSPDTGFEIEYGLVPPQFNTRFERKWVGLGFKVFFQIVLKKTKHIET